MKIGVIAPLAYPIPPKTYGGTESVIYFLVEGLVSKGHEVTLFATDDSETSADLDSTYAKQITGLPLERKNAFQTLKRINYIASISDKFDLIHNHDGLVPMCQSEYFKVPMVTTSHTDLSRTIGDDVIRQELFRNNNIISISNSQRKGFPEAKYIGTVYNGTVSLDDYSLGCGGDYLVWIGRFNPYKGAKEAIEIAKKAGKKLFLAAKIEEENRDYFDQYIKPELDDDSIVYLGEIGLQEKVKLLMGAWAYLMPISWDEPFGLVMIEAMACGTPVIAFNRGSVPEVVEDKVTGYIVDEGDIDAAVAAVGAIDKIKREDCRKRVQDNFSIENMVSGYERIYEDIIAEHSGK
ncbi:MAG: glycosyltransferase family 4 protein [Candidatus Berkelbacteria bacterium]